MYVRKTKRHQAEDCEKPIEHNRHLTVTACPGVTPESA